MKITKTQSGKFQTKLAYYDVEGKRRYKTFTARTKTEVKNEAELWRIDHKDFTSQPSYGNLTVEQAVGRYIDSKSKICSPSTIAGYISLKERSLGLLRDIRLNNLNIETVQIAVNEYAAGRAPKTVRNWFGLISSTLKIYAPGLDVSKITLPARQKQQRYVPTAAQVSALVENAQADFRAVVMLAAFGGLRRSEICALTAADVTDTGVRVAKAAVEDKDGSIVIKSTKTTAGDRFVPLPPAVVAELRGWTAFGMKPRTIKNRWYTLLNRCGFERFGFHSLRRYFASQLHANGIPDKYICEIGGWDDVNTLRNSYEHTMTDSLTAFSAKVISIFSPQMCGENVAKSS